MKTPISSIKSLTPKFAYILKSTAVDVNKKHQFKKECVAILVAIVQKLQEKSPCKHLLVRCTSCLDLHRMAQNKEECSLRFIGIVDRLYENKWITSNDADLAKKEFDTFLETVQHEYEDDFLMYHVKSKRIHHFIGSCVHGNDKYRNCWKIIMFVFVLFHGQSVAERSFSINKEGEVENLKKVSLISQ